MTVPKSLIIITGQTATGKTSHALKLAKKVGGELVSCDSRQVYKGLDIITGKDLPRNSHFEIVNSRFPLSSTTFASIGCYQMEGIKVWGYDAVAPKDYFSSYDYKILASAIINNIIDNGKIPIVVGGTYLYLKHLLYGIDTENIPPDWKLRKSLERKTVSELKNKLSIIDSNLFKAMNQSDQSNPRRLIRKIEISLAKNNGNPALKLEDNKPKYHIDQFIGIRFKNENELTNTVVKRVRARLKKGALNEVKGLLDRGYMDKDPGLVTIGYKQLIAFIKGELTEKEAIDQWITAELQYAKRQYMFMKKDANIHWTFV